MLQVVKSEERSEEDGYKKKQYRCLLVGHQLALGIKILK